MARIVFAGELESGGDRLRRSLPIAQRLQAGEHSVFFILADVIAADTLLTPKGIAFVPAPRFARRPLSAHRTENFWQILATLGDEDRTALLACVRAWTNLFDLLAAEAIVIDSAPCALLAARISHRSVRLIEPVALPPANHSSNALALEHVNAIVRALGGTPLSCLADLIAPARTSRDPSAVTGSHQGNHGLSVKRRIVYAWELGANAGHLERGLAIGEGLRERGHEVTFVVRDLSLAERLLGARGFNFMPTPWTALSSPRRATINFSDLLLTCGFDDARALGARVRAWTHLLGHLEPDTIVIDHAPTAQLAAYIADLSSIQVGSGFCIPPLAQPFPSIQPHLRITRQQLASADQRALSTVNHVVSNLGARPLPHLSELFARSPQIVTTFKELDPYSGRDGVYVGPVERATGYPDVHWRTVGRIRVFVYLRPFIKGLDELLQSLQACGGEVKCVLPGASAATVTQYRSVDFEIFIEPIEIGSLLKEADVVIGYGSAGLLARALLAGVPLLLLPDVLERIINSTRVAELGAGIVLFEDRDPAAIMTALRALTSQSRYRAAAREFAAKYRDSAPGVCERIVAAIEQCC